MQTVKQAIIIFIILVGCWSEAIGQRNVIKARLLAAPIPFAFVYSLGVGYERVISNRVSAQVLYNLYGYDGGASDGDAEDFVALAPEVRYYFTGTNEIVSSFFGGVFVDLLRGKLTASGESFSLQSGQKEQVSPGVLLGKNTRLFPRWYLETYLGVKYSRSTA